MAPLKNHKDLEIFVITNGRNTFKYVMKSLKKQSIERKITVIENMKWVDALNKCIDLCESKFFLRVDDDMILHEYCVEYYLSKMPRMDRKAGGVYVCRLWEDWSNKPVHGLRMYSHKAARRLGFVPSKLGKVDKVFHKKLGSIKKRQIRDTSIVGVHALGSTEDQKMYRDLWRDKNVKISKQEFKTTFDNKIHPVGKNVKQQYALLKNMRRINKRYGTPYLEYISKKREAEKGDS